LVDRDVVVKIKRHGRPGKGAGFERLLCRTLSLWLSEGEHRDLFSRNVLSGGRFTLAAKQNRARGMPGDVMPADPAAFAFASVFMVEAKHWRSLGLDQFILRPTAKCPLLAAWNHAVADAKSVGLVPLLIAKQNNMPTLVMSYTTVITMAAGSKVIVHYFRNGELGGMTLDDFCNNNPDILLTRVKRMFLLTPVKGGTDAADNRPTSNRLAKGRVPLAGIRRDGTPVKRAPNRAVLRTR
jgi:hypothetical protein